MEYNQLEKDEVVEKPNRPTFLLILCILSFVTIGFGIIGCITGLLSGPLSSDELEKIMADSLKMVQSIQETGNQEVSDMFEKIVRSQEYINNNFYVHNLVQLITLIVGFFSVYQMYALNKNGFKIYILYNFMSILLVYVSVPMHEIPGVVLISNFLISGFFVFLYSRNLKYMS